MAKRIVKMVKVVVSFIRQHHAPLAIFHHYETNLMLLNPTKTRFATNFLMVERLFKLKLAIEQIVANLDGQLLSIHCMAIIIKSHSPKQELFKPT
jgi:hypothetical protein